LKNIKHLKQFVISKFENEAPTDLYYHGIHHILGVLEVCNGYIIREGISEENAYLLRTAALLHDIAIFSSHTDHEKKSVEYANNLLTEWGYTKPQIARIEGMIMATKLPQNPHNLLEEILCDADLDYLGTSDFYSIGDTLYQEFMAYHMVSSKDEWNKIQIHFLENHTYHTDYAKKYRRPQKLKFLNELRTQYLK
jgi:predicted metal-dependent HD superfamily phosphohydrolase